MPANSASNAQSLAAVAGIAAAGPSPLADLAASSRSNKQHDAKPAGRRWFTQLSDDDDESDEFGFSRERSISEDEVTDVVVQQYNEQPQVQAQQHQPSRGGSHLVIQTGPSMLAWLPQVSN
jgi:hypothetical protein